MSAAAPIHAFLGHRISEGGDPFFFFFNQKNIRLYLTDSAQSTQINDFCELDQIWQETQ